MRKIATNNVISRYVGANPVLKRYVGVNEVWSPIATYDTDFQTNVLDVATTQGYTIPDNATLTAMNQLMVDMKSIGFYQAQDTIGIFSTGGTTFGPFSMIDWKKTSNIYTPYGGLTYTSNGFKGNGTDAYVGTNFNPFTMGINYTQNLAGRGGVVYFQDYTVFDGVVGSTHNSIVLSTSSVQYINTFSGQLNTTVPLGGTGFKSINRDSASGVRVITTIEYSRTSTVLEVADYEQVILRRSGLHSTNGISMYYMGGSLTNTIAQGFRTIYNQYLSSIGLSQFA